MSPARLERAPAGYESSCSIQLSYGDTAKNRSPRWHSDRAPVGCATLLPFGEGRSFPARDLRPLHQQRGRTISNNPQDANTSLASAIPKPLVKWYKQINMRLGKPYLEMMQFKRTARTDSLGSCILVLSPACRGGCARGRSVSQVDNRRTKRQIRTISAPSQHPCAGTLGC